MNKSRIVLVVAALFLVASVVFALSQRKQFNSSLKEFKSEYKQVEYVSGLQKLWGAKGIKSKLNQISNIVPANKKERYLVKRAKADIKFNSLNQMELNKILSKLAMLPIQFKKLLVVRDGDKFTLECTCVW